MQILEIIGWMSNMIDRDPEQARLRKKILKISVDLQQKNDFFSRKITACHYSAH
jgi:hypothetical protein